MNSQIKVINSSELNNIPIENGFFIYTSDDNKLYLDNNENRECLTNNEGSSPPIVKLFSQTLSSNSSIIIDLSSIDLSKYQELELTMSDLKGTTDSDANLKITFNGDTAESSYIIDSNTSAGYIKLGYVRNSMPGRSRVTLMSCAGKLITYAEHLFIGSDYLYGPGNYKGCWLKGDLAQVKTIRVSSGSGAIAAGTSIVLYGKKK